MLAHLLGKFIGWFIFRASRFCFRWSINLPGDFYIQHADKGDQQWLKASVVSLFVLTPVWAPKDELVKKKTSLIKVCLPHLQTCILCTSWCPCPCQSLQWWPPLPRPCQHTSGWSPDSPSDRWSGNQRCGRCLKWLSPQWRYCFQNNQLSFCCLVSYPQ